MKKNKKALTLIELVSVLVILAILALIVTPLVLNIIKKARIAADKRSIDAYGRSIELAVADYLLENGKFPTSIDELTIEYSGDVVSCATTKLNSDSSVYLSGCTVGNRAVEGYTYGKEEIVTYEAYSVGDEVRYNNVDYYVIKDSTASESSVKLLKATTLTVEEVNTYGGAGTSNNHVNMYVEPNVSYYQQAYDNNGYGGMQYYSSETCKVIYYNFTVSGCTIEYEQSEIKYVVDAWKAAMAPAAREARLVTFDEVSSLGYTWGKTCPTCGDGWIKTENVPSWIYNNDYSYWTMSAFGDSTDDVYRINKEGRLDYDTETGVYNANIGVRPVIVLSKSAL